jgi:hypothetical protein
VPRRATCGVICNARTLVAVDLVVVAAVGVQVPGTVVGAGRRRGTQAIRRELGIGRPDTGEEPGEQPGPDLATVSLAID